MSENGRYFLSQDDDCHWYLVPVDHVIAWKAWCEIPGYDERSWDVPIFATAIDGPHRLTFADPIQEVPAEDAKPPTPPPADEDHNYSCSSCGVTLGIAASPQPRALCSECKPPAESPPAIRRVFSGPGMRCARCRGMVYVLVSGICRDCRDEL